jgi:hypothetical protein
MSETKPIVDKDRLQMYISVTKITIVLCWLSLFAFWAIKIFGGNWFEIMVENENFIKFSDAVQNTWLKYFSSFITIFIARYFTFGAICQKFVFKGKTLFLVLAMIISMWIVVNFIDIPFLNMWYAYILIATFAIFYQKKWKKLYGLLVIAFDFIFSTVSILTRNIELQIITDYLVGYILLIDMNIMYFIYYLYSNLLRLKKEN